MSAGNQAFPIRMPMTVGLIALAVLLGGFGTWAATTNIAGAIIAPGAVEVDSNRQVVQHPDGGVVEEIRVDDGDSVAAGDVLLRLDPTLLQSELLIIEGQLYGLQARRARLEAERIDAPAITFDDDILAAAEVDPEVARIVEVQSTLFEARAETIARQAEQLAKRRDQIADQVVGIEAQQEAVQQMLRLIERELTDQQDLLDRGLAQASRVLSLQREEARLAGNVGELTAQKAQAEGRMTEIDIQIQQLLNQRREEANNTLGDLQFRERELAQQARALRERLSRMEIRAPVSGVMHGLAVFAPRSVIRPADPVMFLVPQDRPLVISAEVAPIHRDEIALNQDVTLRFSSLDQRTTPELIGRVTQISADAFEDERTSMRYYRVEIVLKDGEVDRLPEGATLTPGMPVEAFLRTADRTPLAYLVKPVTDYFVQAFRET